MNIFKEYPESLIKWGLQGRRILITGGTGFMGRALCKYLLEKSDCTIVVFSRDWHKQKALETELGHSPRMRWFIGDIRDKDRLHLALSGIDYVIHTAAFKDVVLGEYNSRELLLTNCVGTQYVIEEAIENKVDKVIFISTDKSVASINGYGKSKALAESLIISANNYSRHTRFSATRFGNISGSYSSVIPLFVQQAQEGKSLTVTHPKMTRFWITQNQAVEFILLSLCKMTGGEIFVPHLYAAKIMSIATTISPHSEIEIVGTRPGEKLHEVLVAQEESRRTYDVGWGYQIAPEYPFWSNMKFKSSGCPVGEDWTYSSASAQRLSEEQIRGMIQT